MRGRKLEQGVLLGLGAGFLKHFDHTLGRLLRLPCRKYGPFLALFCLCLSPDLAAKPWRLELKGEQSLAAPDFLEPAALAIGPLGQVYVSDLGRGTIMQLAADGSVAFEFEAPRGQPDLLAWDLAVTGFQVYVLDAVSNSLLRFSDKGSFLDILQNFAEEGIDTPRALAVDATGRVLLANPTLHSARIVNELQVTETIVKGFGSKPGEFSAPQGAAFMPDGSFFIADTGNARLQQFSEVGNLKRVYGQGLKEPRSLATGRFGELYVVDAAERRIAVFHHGRLQAELRLPEHRPVDIAIHQNALMLLSEDPPALLRVEVTPGDEP